MSLHLWHGQKRLVNNGSAAAMRLPISCSMSSSTFLTDNRANLIATVISSFPNASALSTDLRTRDIRSVPKNLAGRDPAV